ncbi:uncharacterized protein STEHIDRAFT_97694 [Stereum hirsutum FP-91666 SS1]|uniref:uncharacterized protein n=1 Tax=Stereum hirsutum (strain FP-91666) TaxID=721885 RepID=UPI0004449DE1|nr:uncharacterized protein STEHIDRAFT_97694 [Stereum hirsutum FP-91666 SS1]EIM86861.1 hypothetical protein STEHIDRAFT_97694 [Stereum hirsutum FP-91666 SS1]
MNSYGSSSSLASDKPDKPLVVKCALNNRNKKVTFESARNCTYDILRQRAEQAFMLAARPFVFKWKDDDDEETQITNDADLAEAIGYFHQGADEAPTSSSSSILSGRSFLSRKITVKLQIDVEYDGPSLSDSSSLASAEEYQLPGGSEFSFSLGARTDEPPDDDAVTVSSRDTGSRGGSRRPKETLFRKIFDSRSRSPADRHRGTPPPSTSNGSRYLGVPASDAHSAHPSGSSSYKFNPPPRSDSLTSGTPAAAYRGGETNPSSSAVFERLKLQSNTQSPSPYGSTPLQDERGAAWLQDQSMRVIKATLGTLPSPSSEADTFSLNTDHTIRSGSDPDPEAMDGDLSLEVDHRGKYYYAYKSGSGMSEASRDSDDPFRDQDGDGDAGYEAGPSMAGGTPIDGVHKDRPFSLTTLDSSAQTDYPPSSETPSYRRSHPFSFNSDQPQPPPFAHQSHTTDGFSIPPELLVPEEVTDCSECGEILDTMRYVCTTCGEKKAWGRAELKAFAAVGKGKGRDIFGGGSESGSSMTYPPPNYGHASSSSISTLQGFDTDSSSGSGFKSRQLPQIPNRPPHLKLHPSSSPSTTAVGSNSGISAAASNSTLNLSHTHGHRSQSSGSSFGTRVEGYELCATCIQSSGVNHSFSATQADANGFLTSGSGSFGGFSGDGSGSYSPNSPLEQQELSVLRRSAPKQKGALRHAYLEKMWGFSGWEDVVQDDGQTSKCSGCQSMIFSNRYKCASCENFTLCRACYNDVHNIHPVHAFLAMPDKPARSRSVPDLMSQGSNGDASAFFDAADEPSLKHPGVKCFHCMQDVVGARFRCIDCTTMDVDICANCEAAGLPGNLDSSDGGHNSSHVMLKIPTPLNTTEVMSVSRRAYRLHHARGQVATPSSAGLTRSSPGSASSVFGKTVMNGDMGMGADDDDEDHLMLCDSCGQSIVGVRYQCLSCPGKPISYNLCSSCEESSYHVHDAFHIFIKLPRPVDELGPLQSSLPILPKLYKEPAGPPGGLSSSSRNPSAYLRDLRHKSALCDRHMEPIVGKWYRCVYCAKDLCGDCESIDEHDMTHCFMVFKAPVDIGLFKHYADLENPAGSPPVLNGPVYYPRD